MEITVRFPKEAVERIGEMQQNGYLDGSTAFEAAVDDAVTSDAGQRVLFNLQERLPVTVSEDVAAAFIERLVTHGWENGRTIGEVSTHVRYGSARAHSEMHGMELSGRFHDEYEDEPRLAPAVNGSRDLAEVYELLLDTTHGGKRRVGAVKQALQQEFSFDETLAARVVSSWTVTKSKRASTTNYVVRPKTPAGADTVNQKWAEL